MKKNAWRAMIEVAFIVFLFYSNLLMGEFERSGMGQKRGLAWAIGDVFTAANFAIAAIAALVGYSLLEFLRNRFQPEGHFTSICRHRSPVCQIDSA
jgi:hypothetical protein